jgi:hypothetical protein
MIDGQPGGWLKRDCSAKPPSRVINDSARPWVKVYSQARRPASWPVAYIAIYFDSFQIFAR